MRNKCIKYAVAFVLGAGLFACYNDKGNYDYLSPEEVMNIKVDGLESQRHPLGSVISLTPELTGLDAESNYDFVWYLYKEATYGVADTVSRERNLVDYLVNYPVGTYKMGYSIRDRRNGVRHVERFNFHVVSPFSNGWIVAKDEGGETDVDFLSKEDGVFSDLIYNVNGFKLQGQAKQVFYQSAYYGHTSENEDGTVTALTNQKAIHVLTDTDAATFTNADISLYKRGSEMFFDDVDVIKPGTFFFNGYWMGMINQGTLYASYIMGDYIGKIQSRPYLNSYDYYLEDMLIGTGTQLFFFDRNSRSFLTSGYFDKKISTINGDAHNNMDRNFVECLPRNIATTSPTAFVIMTDLTGNNYYVYNFSSTTSTPLKGVNPVPDGSALITAKFRAAHPLNEAIYHSTGNNILQTYTTTSGIDRVSLTFPAGESITCVQTMRRFVSSGLYENKLMIGVSTGSGYKAYVYGFKGDTPEIADNPDYTFTGSGGVIRSFDYIP